MEQIEGITSKLEYIKTIFQDAKDVVTKTDDNHTLVHYLENIPVKFRSVAYEGVAMGLALKDFSSKEFIDTKFHSLKRWNSFLQISKGYASHVHVGLGWAIAEAKPDDLSFITTIHPLMQFRVWDGCGYYNGIFSQRQTIRNQLRPEYIHQINFKAFDEGIGRSFWYSFKGDVTRVATMIQIFSPARHSDLWRGIGIASIFVGGCDEPVLKQLFLLAEKNSIQLCIGAAMVAKARVHTNSTTNDVELACAIWCNNTAQEAMLLIDKTESSADSFESFLLQTEKEINKVS